MRKAILILGPSGVGKGTACRILAQQFSQWRFEELDSLASQWALSQRWIEQANVHVLNVWCNHPGLFLAIGLQAIADGACRERRPLIIDVGAGFQDAAYA